MPLLVFLSFMYNIHKQGVLAERCYGCGRCLPVCPYDKISKPFLLPTLLIVYNFLPIFFPVYCYFHQICWHYNFEILIFSLIIQEQLHMYGMLLLQLNFLNRMKLMQLKFTLVEGNRAINLIFFMGFEVEFRLTSCRNS